MYQTTDLSCRDLRKDEKHLVRTTLNKVNVEGSNLSGGQFPDQDFSYSNARRANLTSVRLQGARITKTVFDGACLKWSILIKIEGTSASFIKADLSLASLNDACLKKTSFRGAGLSFACLNDAKLVECDLSFTHMSYTRLINTCVRDSSLHGADLRSTDLSEIRACHADLGGDAVPVIWNKQTVWPKDMTGFVNIPTILQQHLGL